ncbi:hypothetical protein OKW37_004845 [Paraburkholderia sp. MM5482-R2]
MRVARLVTSVRRSPAGRVCRCDSRLLDWLRLLAAYLLAYLLHTAEARRRWRRCDADARIQPSPIGDIMSYMLLIVEPTDQREERAEAAGRDLYDQMVRFSENLKARGKLLAVESLTSQKDAVRVQVRHGQSKLVDGPFAEAKEMIGGFFLLNCDSREEAVAIAQTCPAASWCTVEVRKLGPCFI